MSFQADHHDTRSLLPSREARGRKSCIGMCSAHSCALKGSSNTWIIDEGVHTWAHSSSLWKLGRPRGKTLLHYTQCNGSKANGILIMWPNQPGKRLFPTLALGCTQDSAGFGRKWRVRCRGVSLNYDRRKRINWLIELYKGRDRNNTSML